MSKPTQAEMGDLLLRLRTDHQKEMDAAAVGWVTVSRDLESGSLYIVGPYSSRAVAVSEALHDEREVNRDVGDDELGWLVTVHRLMPTKRTSLAVRAALALDRIIGRSR